MLKLPLIDSIAYVGSFLFFLFVFSFEAGRETIIVIWLSLKVLMNVKKLRISPSRLMR